MRKILRRHPLKFGITEPFINRKTGKFNVEQFKLLDMWDIQKDRYYVSSRGRIVDMCTKSMIEPDEVSKQNVRLINTKGNSKLYLRKRLVSETFLRKSTLDIAKNRNMVTFMNGNKDDCCLDNLVYVNFRELSIYTSINKGGLSDRHKRTYIMNLLKADYTIPEIVKTLPFNVDVKLAKSLRCELRKGNK